MRIVPIVIAMTRSPDILGWLSSFVLVLTIGRQVYRQWASGQSEGVSGWLFVGQMIASIGFTTYSWMLRSWVFVVTNALLFVSALVGWLILRQQRRRTAMKKTESKSTFANGSLRSFARS